MPGKLGAIKFEYSNADLDSFFDDDFDDWKDDTTDLDDLLEAGELDDSYNMNIATPSYQQGGKGYASSAVPSQNAMPKKLNRSYYDEDPSSGWKKWIKCLLVFLVITTMLIMQSARSSDPTAEGTLLPTDKVNELHDDGNSPSATPTNAEISSGSPTEKEVNITTLPTLSPTAADGNSPSATPTNA
jgi:cytoskeletal protein RodZ